MTESKPKTSTPKNTHSSNKVMPIMVTLIVIGAFAIGLLWGKLQAYEKGGAIAGSRTVEDSGQAAAAAAPPQQQPEDVIATVSVDDDPVMGQEDATLTMIEFSDYECPFCKRFFDDTLGQLKEEYIDTGKVKLVYRDLPLSFHDPMATKEAIAAECARKQGGDDVYFKYHDEIFNRTASNGNGLSEDDLNTITSELSLNIGQFSTCIEDPAMDDEVKKDVADAATVGATGTPTFFIGKTTNSGEIEGQMLVGAQPLAAFQALIDPLLDE